MPLQNLNFHFQNPENCKFNYFIFRLVLRTMAQRWRFHPKPRDLPFL